MSSLTEKESLVELAGLVVGGVLVPSPEMVEAICSLLIEQHEAMGPLAAISDEYSDAEDDDFQVWKDFDVLGATLPLKHFRRLAAVHTKAQEPLK